MSHPAQVKFVKRVRRLYKHFFQMGHVIDVGSQDINGNNKRFFSKRCNYIGIDLMKGKNVDLVGRAHMLLPAINASICRKIEYMYRHRIDYNHLKERPISVIISTEAAEHDENWKETLAAIYEYTRPGGLIIITAAGDGRAEHGTIDHSPGDSPATSDYYHNVSNEMFASILRPDMFKVYHLAQDDENKDLQFYGIKKEDKKIQ